MSRWDDVLPQLYDEFNIEFRERDFTPAITLGLFVSQSLSRGVGLVCGIKGCRKSPFEGVCKAIQEKVITLSKPKNNKNRFTAEQWEQLPDSVQYRSIRYRITGRTEELIIVTTLLDSKQYSAEDIAELDGLRWDVETDIASWKTAMGYCDLRCHTPQNLDREIAVGVLAYNLVRSLMNDAAAVLEIHPREIKRRNQSKYPKLKTPRPSRAKRITAERVKPPEKPSVHAIRARVRFSRYNSVYRCIASPLSRQRNHWTLDVGVNALKIHHAVQSIRNKIVISVPLNSVKTRFV